MEIVFIVKKCANNVRQEIFQIKNGPIIYKKERTGEYSSTKETFSNSMYLVFIRNIPGYKMIK